MCACHMVPCFGYGKMLYSATYFLCMSCKWGHIGLLISCKWFGIVIIVRVYPYIMAVIFSNFNENWSC
jgi:hypothetical protein